MSLRHFRSSGPTGAISLAFLAVSILATGCSSVEVEPASSDGPVESAMTQAELEQRVAQRYQPKDEDTKYTAECDGDLELTDDATQDCLVLTSEQEVGVRVVIGDSDAADLDLQTTPFLPAQTVADSIGQSLEIQGYTGVTASCDGDLVGEIGQTIVCTMNLETGKTDVNVEVTSVDALQVDYAFTSA